MWAIPILRALQTRAGEYNTSLVEQIAYHPRPVYAEIALDVDADYAFRIFRESLFHVFEAKACSDTSSRLHVQSTNKCLECVPAEIGKNLHCVPARGEKDM